MSDEVREPDLFVEIERALGDVLNAPRTALRAAPAAESAFGDVVSHAALRVAAGTGRAPRELAGELADVLRALGCVSDVAVAGPGFLNISYTDAAIREALAAFEGAQRASEPERIAVTVLDGASLRQRWTAEAAVRIAQSLSHEAALVDREGDSAAAKAALAPHLKEGGAFGSATKAEMNALAAGFARLQAARDGARRVIGFADISAALRPGLFEAAWQGAELGLVALAPVQVEAMPREYEELAKLYVLAHRPERLSEVTVEMVREPRMTNPAFALHYCAAKLQRLKTNGGASHAPNARVIAIRLLYFPHLLERIHEEGAPFRLGLYLAELARDIVALGLAGRGRDEKAIYGPLIAAAEIVFSQGFAMLGATPLEEIA